MPLYLRLAELLASGIVAGHYRPGERLPPEMAFSISRGASVDTVRKALTI